MTSLKRMNESFKLFAESALKESSERNELRAALQDVIYQLMSKGATLKEFEIAFQDVIERFYPDKCWWEVCDLNIFWHLLESRDPEETAEAIVASIERKEESRAPESETASADTALKRNAPVNEDYVLRKRAKYLRK